MTGMILRRGGGSAASISVINAESVDALGAGRENQIAVIGSERPGAVYAQAYKPTAAADGDIWICPLGAKIAANIAEKGAIEINVGSVYQKSGGVWMQREAHIYADGAWKEIAGSTVLYDRGAQFDGETGGWMTAADGNGTVSFEDDHILIETTTSATRKGVVTTTACRTSRHTRVCALIDVMTVKAGTTQVLIGTHTSDNPKVGTSGATATSTTAKPTKTGVMQIMYEYGDIEEDLHVWLSLANASAAEIKILRVWLE